MHERQIPKILILTRLKLLEYLLMNGSQIPKKCMKIKDINKTIQKEQYSVVGGVIFLLFFLVIGLNSCQSESKQPQSIIALAERIQSGLSEHFVFELVKSPNEQFEISSKGNKVIVRGSTLSSITTGLGWYLKYYCNSGTFWTVKRNPIPVPLPKVNGKVVHHTSAKYRYYFNYTCDRYSYRFWDWTRWEQEIDWMALNGVNIALIAIDRGAVLWKVSESYGVREMVNRYIGGGIMPFTQFHYQLHEYEMAQRDIRVRLQQTVIARMREMGIEPVLDGFKGIVPKQLAETVKHVKFNDGGMWGTFSKEPVIDIADPFFEEFGAKYYQTQKELYGDQLFIDADPIIEGSGPEVDYGDYGLKIQNLILNTYPDATWILQGWAGNPRDQLLTKTNPERTLILDLACEYRPQWKKREIHNFTPWAFCILNNYGGKTGLYGNLDNIFDQQAEAKSTSPQGELLRGVGALMEAIDNNPVIWNALFESVWLDTKPDMQVWIQDYIKSRYGKQNEHAEKAWGILYKKIYSTSRTQVVGATENIMCARPQLTIDKVWRGCTSVPYFTNEDIVIAWDEMLSAADELSCSDGFQLDIVELTREIIGNCAWVLYPKVIAAHQEGNKVLFNRLSEQFLDMFDDLDMVLSTRKEFMLGTWIERHRSWGQNEIEKSYFEKAAKSILTIYSDRPITTHDYAHREWAGTMKDFYKTRFEKYFNELRKTTNKNAEPQIDWFEFDYSWTITPYKYTTRASCCPVDACKIIHNKYRNQIN